MGCDSIEFADSVEDTMPWTETARRHYRREGLRYASDMTDAEWALIAPFMPPPNRIGRPRTTDLRAVVKDCDGAVSLLAAVRRLCPWLRHLFADGG